MAVAIERNGIRLLCDKNERKNENGVRKNGENFGGSRKPNKKRLKAKWHRGYARLSSVPLDYIFFFIISVGAEGQTVENGSYITQNYNGIDSVQRH